MPNLTGQSLGRYHILEQLGEGGMATVYKAYDTRLERDVAIKVIRRGLFGDEMMERMLKRFEREAKSLARLNHPNIIPVIDYGEYEGSPYLVMPYFPGGTLKQRLGKPMPWQAAVRLLIPIAQALEYAHEQAIIHRDVKPSNILLTVKGQPMLTDFGIARLLESEATQTLTGTGVGIGTPEYMAPEQANAKSVDQRADIYSLGIVFYEMVTGRIPYTADTPMAVMIMQVHDPLPRPAQFVTGLPERVEKFLLKALAKKPEDRYQNMGEVIKALDGLLAGQGLPAEKAEEPALPETRQAVLPETELDEHTLIARSSPPAAPQASTASALSLAVAEWIRNLKSFIGRPSVKRWLPVGILVIFLGIAVSIGLALSHSGTKGREAPPASAPGTVAAGMPGLVDIVTPENGLVLVGTAAIISSVTPGETVQPVDVQAAPPEIIDTWFYQETTAFSSDVWYAFIVKNPNPDLALEKATVQIVAYDAAGAILGEAALGIGVLFPGEQRAMTGEGGFSVPTSSTVARISVQLTHSAEAYVSDQRGSPFTAEKAAYFPGQIDSRVTGVIRNHLNADVNPIQVTAIAYDKSGHIIGAGKSAPPYVEILPANRVYPVVVKINKIGEPARVELYPYMYEKSLTAPSPAADALHIKAVGGIQKEFTDTNWGMIVENNDSKAHFNVQCGITFYDGEGQVLEVDIKTFPVIFPGERLGISGNANLPVDTTLGSAEAQTCSGSIDESNIPGFQKAGLLANPLTADKATYQQDEQALSNGIVRGLISGTIKNSYDKDLTSLMITAIAYDASGAIIGGWESTGGSITAHGQYAYSIQAGLKSPPASIEIYPTLFGFNQWQ